MRTIALTRGEAERFTRKFLVAQNEDGAYEQALKELRDGRKMSHWIWFVLPQLAGKGLSPMSQQYAIPSMMHAKAYLQHNVLRMRYMDTVAAIQSHCDDEGGVKKVMDSSVDFIKLVSSLTLFEIAARRLRTEAWDLEPDLSDIALACRTLLLACVFGRFDMQADVALYRCHQVLQTGCAQGPLHAAQVHDGVSPQLLLFLFLKKWNSAVAPFCRLASRH